MRFSLVKILSFNAGYLDTASFLALNGLFAAHVTGNFVTLGAAWVSDSEQSILPKLIALPVFCFTIFLVKLWHSYLYKLNKVSYDLLLKLILFFLTIAAITSVLFRHMAVSQLMYELIIGMSLVIAMAIQNALQRLYWLKDPPSTVMTGSTTQLMLDLAEYVTNSANTTLQKNVLKQKISKIFPTMLNFALGCLIAACFYKFANGWLFVMAPFIFILAYTQRENFNK